MLTKQEQEAFAKRRLLVILLAGAAGVLAGMGLLYGINALKGNPGTAAAGAVTARSRRTPRLPHRRIR